MTIKGFGYPDFQPSPRGYLPIVEDLEAIKGNLRMLLTIYKGERVNMPDYGTNLDRYLFRPNVDQLHNEIRREIIDAIEAFEPRIVLDDLEVRRPTLEDLGNAAYNEGIVFIRITFRPKFDLELSDTLSVLF